MPPEKSTPKNKTAGPRVSGPFLLRRPLQTGFQPGLVCIPPFMQTRWREPHPEGRISTAPEEGSRGSVDRPVWNPPVLLTQSGQCYSCGQMGHLCHECPMMECEIGWEVNPLDHTCTNKSPLLTVPVRLGKKTITTLLDIGSYVSLVRAHLVPQDRPILWYTSLAGVY